MYDVLTIGTATRDVFLRSKLFRPVTDIHFLGSSAFPTGEAECFAFGGKIDVDAPVFTVGGGAVNSAVTFARQGLKTAAMCAVGKDEAGKAVMNALKHENIKSIISYIKDIGTSYSTLLLSDRGERTILVYRGASDYLGRSHQLETRAVYVAPGAMPHQSLLRLLRRYKTSGSLIAMNPSGHYIKLGTKTMRSFFELIDILIMNREEAASLTGIVYHEERNIFERLRELYSGTTVVTNGARGSVVLYGEQLFRAGIFANEKVVDRTGAGDAFGSGFVASLLCHPDDIKEAIRLGSANATAVVEVVGATSGILTKAQFEIDERWKQLPIIHS